MIRVAIVGATGYTGSELVRLLHRHPEVSLEMITSESRAGAPFSEVHPQFEGLEDRLLVPAQEVLNSQLDVLFLALPHGVSMEYVKQFWNTRSLIVDLSGDYRLSGPEVYEHWYGKPHHFTEAFDQSVYGLPELHRSQIQAARLVANPGCYPTSAILALAPLIAAGWVDPKSVVIDSKSGITGAGVKAKPTNHYSNVNENFRAYGLKTHRHTVEIEEQLSGLQSEDLQVQFTPHLLPIDRGILSTVYARPIGKVDPKKLQRLYADFYSEAPFVRLRSQAPGVKEVRGTNFCDLYPTYDERTHRILVLSAIDNLIKGAAGQAVHNMNLMLGLEETMGIPKFPLQP